jgi:hypothetical protein
MTRRLLIGIALVGAALLLPPVARALLPPVAAALQRFSEEAYFQTTLGPRVRQKYGFEVGTPFVQAGRRKVEVAELRVRPGGLLARAGVREGDLLADETLGQLYRLLAAPKGAVISIRVVPGGDGPPLSERPVRIIVVTGPG